MADHHADTIRPLSPDTWDAFAALVEKHNGVWNGCWCTWFIAPKAERHGSGKTNPEIKKQCVDEGGNHAALVFDGELAVGWCEYGTPAELPTMKHSKQYDAETTVLPDYRLTCFFVDRDRRRQGVAEAALRGALDLIAAGGGGLVEAYPHDIGEKKVSSSFLYNGTRAMFEKAGFVYDRAKGETNCVMTITVPAA
jgi:GNAT superfamily N-acetyltransferase